MTQYRSIATASTQQGRLAEQSRTVTDDIHRISRGERPESDLVNGFVSMVAQRAEEFTSQLENKEPADLLKDVRRFAARRPGAFLAIAAGIGLAAGRLTRGLTDSDDTGTDSAPGSPGQARLTDTPRYDTTPTTPAPPVVPHGDVAGLTPENTPGDTLATGGNKHHLDPDPAAPVDGYLGGGSAIDPEERR